jgi:hypothetical protein
MNPIEVLIECGTTYQPLTIGLQLLKNTHNIKRVHVLTTFSAYEGAMTIIEEFFPDVSVIYYGEFVDGGGRLEDQREYRSNVESALRFVKHPVIGLVASGTNWMTWIFSQLMSQYPCYYVRTRKEFEDKCFLPQENIIGTDDEGNVYRHEGVVSSLMPLQGNVDTPRLYVRNRKISFLGHEVSLTMQEAAMYDYLLRCGGELYSEDEHTIPYNSFCESHEDYDTERSLVEDFISRFRQNVSKINSKIEEAHPIVVRHISIERDGEKYRLRTVESLL